MLTPKVQAVDVSQEHFDHRCADLLSPIIASSPPSGKITSDKLEFDISFIGETSGRRVYVTYCQDTSVLPVEAREHGAIISVVEGKNHFDQAIHPAISRLRGFLESDIVEINAVFRGGKTSYDEMEKQKCRINLERKTINCEQAILIEPFTEAFTTLKNLLHSGEICRGYQFAAHLAYDENGWTGSDAWLRQVITDALSGIEMLTKKGRSSEMRRAIGEFFRFRRHRNCDAPPPYPKVCNKDQSECLDTKMKTGLSHWYFDSNDARSPVSDVNSEAFPLDHSNESVETFEKILSSYEPEPDELQDFLGMFNDVITMNPRLSETQVLTEKYANLLWTNRQFLPAALLYQSSVTRTTTAKKRLHAYYEWAQRCRNRYEDKADFAFDIHHIELQSNWKSFGFSNGQKQKTMDIKATLGAALVTTYLQKIEKCNAGEITISEWERDTPSYELDQWKSYPIDCLPMGYRNAAYYTVSCKK